MKQEKWIGLVILALIAASVFVLVGTHYDAKLHQRMKYFPPKYGLDIRGGVRAVLEADVKHLPPGVTYDQETVQRILTNRINSAGVGEATVQPKGPYQFVIELPDVKDKNAILQQLGTTAQMTFYYFKDVATDRYPDRPIQIPYPLKRDAAGNEKYSFTDRRTGQVFRDGAQIKADFTQLLDQGTGARTGATAFNLPSPLSSILPESTTIYFTSDQQKTALDLNKELTAWNGFISSQPAFLYGSDILPKSTAHMGGQLGTDPAVTQVFDAKGTKEFADFTQQHTGELNGIVLDDAVISAPVIREPILDGEAEISGGFSTLQQAQALANLLNAGALPVPLTQVQTESVEASLGAGAVHQSVLAGAVGLIAVLLFMAIYYRLPGVLAGIALLVYSLFTISIYNGGLKWLGLPQVTLTLPGIAGFILSIGMAVDANILIFERVKEELRNGKSVRPAIDAGFRRAFTAIRDSNICTTITCVVLLTLGTASVKGFALTLLIGVIVSLFSAITVTRTLLYLMVDAGVGNNPNLFGVPRPPVNWDIIGRRKAFYILSLLIIVPGLVFYFMGGLKKSIEFTGGTQMEVKYQTVVTQGAVKSALTSAGYKDNLVQMADGGLSAIVSVRDVSSVGNPALNPVHQKLAQALNTLGPNTEQAFGNVGGIIAAELTSRAFQAVLIAAGLIVLYLAAVFSIGGFVAGLRLGFSAVAALLHDVLVLIGVFSILGFVLNWEIDSLFVTAMLTVIGFSVHDTVVIFDRVRENLRHRSRGEAFEPLVNRSIQQTLTRSFFTSLTVLFTLLALIILGGQTTRLLNVALFIGILSGTYSSIFNAASILVDWENWIAKRRAGAVAAPALAGGGTSGGGSAPRASQLPRLNPRDADVVKADRNDGAAVGTPSLRPKRKKPVRRF